MKVILVSDSHGNTDALDYLRETYQDADAFVHCGDLQIPFAKAADFIAVRGNTDFDPDYPWGRVEEFEGNRVLIVHGHAYLSPFDRDDLSPLARAAKQYACNAVFFGHTHISTDVMCQGIHILNPGSISRPKDYRFPYPTYMVLNITKDGIQAERMVYSPR
ncbi:MAG: metallophosphoesterase [Erysipelotrichaceae bacterium]|nr:metallophosphoesterase [Erysipelotrichaceae bacterium]